MRGVLNTSAFQLWLCHFTSWGLWTFNFLIPKMGEIMLNLNVHEVLAQENCHRVVVLLTVANIIKLFSALIIITLKLLNTLFHTGL